MDFVALIHFGKIKHDDLIREAEQSRRSLRSPRFRRLAKLLQTLILSLP
jgi:hypothetical protein